MLKVFSSGGQKWDTFYKYDSAGRVMMHAFPSAISGYDAHFPDLLDQVTLGDYGYLNTTGLIELNDYYMSTDATDMNPGGVTGYYEDTKIERGKSPTPPEAPITQASTKYYAHNGAVYPVATSSVYRNDDGTGEEKTQYMYTWFPNTN
jgi:hypothetical protein